MPWPSSAPGLFSLCSHSRSTPLPLHPLTRPPSPAPVRAASTLRRRPSQLSESREPQWSGDALSTSSWPLYRAGVYVYARGREHARSVSH